ncbi:MAG: exosortase H-associated membrane protein [Desulfovermiculus sp.]|nr:exosortase H-associated membrane protein [Desulfovermiculus sp.]
MPQKRKLALAVLVFIVAYALFLAAWIQIKPFYGRSITQASGSLASWVMKADLEEVTQHKDKTQLTIAKPVQDRLRAGDLVLDLQLSVAAYSFNVPLTLALMVGLYPLFQWKKRSLLEAVLILVATHMLFVSSYLLLRQYVAFGQAGLISPSPVLKFSLEFLWTFTDNLIVRFEPFLLAIYLWLRNVPDWRLPTDM